MAEALQQAGPGLGRVWWIAHTTVARVAGLLLDQLGDERGEVAAITSLEIAAALVIAGYHASTQPAAAAARH
jgi:hypothetical protein